MAQELILPAHRVGNQSQYAEVLQAQAGRYGSLVDWARARQTFGAALRAANAHTLDLSEVSGLTPDAP